MTITELHQLSSIEKLKIIEALWNDLAENENNLPSPAWHEAELKQTEDGFCLETLRLWIGSKQKKNCARGLNEGQSSKFDTWSYYCNLKNLVVH